MKRNRHLFLVRGDSRDPVAKIVESEAARCERVRFVRVRRERHLHADPRVQLVDAEWASRLRAA